MLTIGSLVQSAMLAFGVVFCVGLSAFALFWTANALEQELTDEAADRKRA